MRSSCGAKDFKKFFGLTFDALNKICLIFHAEIWRSWIPWFWCEQLPLADVMEVFQLVWKVLLQQTVFVLMVIDFDDIKII